MNFKFGLVLNLYSLRKKVKKSKGNLKKCNLEII